jgi:hypothetical protein
MLAGGMAQLWTGLGKGGARVAAAEAAATGAATLQSTFSGSAAEPVLRLAEKAGLSGKLVDAAWKYLSRNFVSGAGSANALVGSEATLAKTFFTSELPSLVANRVSVAMRYIH